MNIRSRLRELGCVKHNYLGDGVYCGYDGYQVWLIVERENGLHEIALGEDDLLPALFNYAREVGSEVAKPIKEAE